MKYCTYCGKAMEDQATACPSCGQQVLQNQNYNQNQNFNQNPNYNQNQNFNQNPNYNQNFNQNPNYNQNFNQQYYGQPYQQPYQQPSVIETAPIWLLILSAFIPLLGICLAVINWNKVPAVGKKYLIAALVGWGISFVLVFASSFLLTFLTTIGY